MPVFSSLVFPPSSLSSKATTSVTIPPSAVMASAAFLRFKPVVIKSSMSKTLSPETRIPSTLLCLPWWRASLRTYRKGFLRL